MHRHLLTCIMQTKTFFPFLNLLVMLLLILAFSLTFSPFTTNDTTMHIASIGGCRMFPADNIWNYDISHLPLHHKSANYTNTLRTDQLQNDFGHPGFAGFPYIVVPNTQRFVPIHFNHYGYMSDPGPYPIPSTAPIEGRDDRHVLALDTGNCKIYELWDAFPRSDGSWNAGGGAIFDLHSNRLRPDGWGSADAAGLPILPGLVRYDEVATGVINHALRGAVRVTQNTYIWPARHSDGQSSDPNAPPLGLRLRLKSSIDVSSFPPQSRVIVRALQHYGMFIADSGEGNLYTIALSGAPDPHWHPSELESLTRIHGSDFEAVDESKLQVSPNSAQADPVGHSPTLAILQTPVPIPTSTVPLCLHGSVSLAKGRKGNRKAVLREI